MSFSKEETMNAVYYKTKYLQNLFLYIENNMTNNLDTELLSSVGCVSRTKLKNDFYSLSGHSVIEYVRKRRLSNALALIKMSDMKLTDIAFNCGYSSHQALCRTVKQTLGLTPTEYKNGQTYYFFSPFNGEALQSVTVSSVIIPRMSRVLFYHTKYVGIEDTAVTLFSQVIPEYKGRIFGRNGTQKGNSFCYELYLTDSNIKFDLLFPYGFEIAGEILQVNTTFATTTVRNNEHRINAAWNYIYSAWLQNSTFEYTGEPYYEEYIMRNNKPFKLKLYLPLRVRGKETKISLIGNPGLRFVVAKAVGRNAEEIASQMVIEYLSIHCPHILDILNETFLQKRSNYYVCGVKINPDLQLVNDKNVTSIFADREKYLVLESVVFGDYNQSSAMLLAFANDNGMEADPDGIFAVYDAEKGFHNLCFKMYCPVRMCPK